MLTVYVDPAWGGDIVSAPAGIDYSSVDLSRNKFQAAFPTGSGVTLSASPPAIPVQTYDFKWTGGGGCGGSATTTMVVVAQDVSCYLSLTPIPPGAK